MKQAALAAIRRRFVNAMDGRIDLGFLSRFASAGLAQFALCGAGGIAAARAATPQASVSAPTTFRLAYPQADAPSESGSSLTQETIVTTESTHDYREISDFFNIREANANVVRGEWEVELTTEWTTGGGEGDDDFALSPNIKYGITDDMWAEIEVLPLNLGDGGDQGEGLAHGRHLHTTRSRGEGARCLTSRGGTRRSAGSRRRRAPSLASPCPGPPRR